MGYHAQPTTPPRTPGKGEQSHPAPSNKSTASAPETGKRPKARNKKRPGDVVTSPGITFNDKNTPPLTGIQSAGIPSSAKAPNTATTAAYAGPTFHASPAPSALPIPSFYSKSIPDSPGTKDLQKLKDLSSTDEVDSPIRPVPNALEQVEREESPLDFIFKAHREEKARARSASSSQDAAVGPFPPPTSQPGQNQTPPAVANIHRSRHGSSSRGSMSGMFAMELDGPNSSSQPYGPAFSTPYSERISAARSGQRARRSNTQSPPDVQQLVDRSAALKAYLFSSPGNAPSQTGTANGLVQQSNPFQNGFPSVQDARPNSGRLSGLRKEVTSPSTSSPSTQPTPNTASMKPSNAPRNSYHTTPPPRQFGSPSAASQPASPYGASPSARTPDVKGMEDSLRKILKLDSAGRA